MASPPDTLLVSTVGVFIDFGVVFGMSCVVALIALLAGAFLAVIGDWCDSLVRMWRPR